jgi:hypothetical protein
MTTLDLSATPVARFRPGRLGLTDRTTGALVGLLFLVATVTFGTADALIGGVLDGSGNLAGASGHRGALAAAALLAFAQGVAIVAIAVLMYPVLRRHHEQRLGMAYVGFRVAEFAATLVYVAVPLLLLQVGDRLGGDAGDALQALFPAQHGAAMLMIYLVTSVGGSTLAVALFRSRLVPRGISVLGVVGYPVLLIGCVLAVFGAGDVSHGPGMLALVPGGLFEIVLPLWLLIKGFTRPARD